MTNLLSNAVKHTAPGQLPRVRILAERRGHQVRLSFHDNGIGVEPKAIEKLFTPFYRAHSSTTPGVGVGLAIVKTAAERMGGQVGVDPMPAGGTCFWLELRAA